MTIVTKLHDTKPVARVTYNASITSRMYNQLRAKMAHLTTEKQDDLSTDCKIGVNNPPSVPPHTKAENRIEIAKSTRTTAC